MERAVLDDAIRVIRLAKDLESLVLGCRRDGEVARVGEHFSRLHKAVDAVLDRLLLLLPAVLGEGGTHLRRGAPALAGVRLVDDDGEAASAMLVADGVEDERELL